jgi:hypothetical protein
MLTHTARFAAAYAVHTAAVLHFLSYLLVQKYAL